MGQAHKCKALSGQSTNIDNVFKSKYLQMIDQFVKKLAAAVSYLQMFTVWDWLPTETY